MTTFVPYAGHSSELDVLAQHRCSVNLSYLLIEWRTHCKWESEVLCKLSSLMGLTRAPSPNRVFNSYRISYSYIPPTNTRTPILFEVLLLMFVFLYIPNKPPSELWKSVIIYESSPLVSKSTPYTVISLSWQSKQLSSLERRTWLIRTSSVLAVFHRFRWSTIAAWRYGWESIIHSQTAERAHPLFI